MGLFFNTDPNDVEAAIQPQWWQDIEQLPEDFAGLEDLIRQYNAFNASIREYLVSDDPDRERDARAELQRREDEVGKNLRAEIMRLQPRTPTPNTFGYAVEDTADFANLQAIEDKIWWQEGVGLHTEELDQLYRDRLALVFDIIAARPDSAGARGGGPAGGNAVSGAAAGEPAAAGAAPARAAAPRGPSIAGVNLGGAIQDLAGMITSPQAMALFEQRVRARDPDGEGLAQFANAYERLSVLDEAMANMGYYDPDDPYFTSALIDEGRDAPGTIHDYIAMVAAPPEETRSWGTYRITSDESNWLIPEIDRLNGMIAQRDQDQLAGMNIDGEQADIARLAQIIDDEVQKLRNPPSPEPIQIDPEVRQDLVVRRDEAAEVLAEFEAMGDYMDPSLLGAARHELGQRESILQQYDETGRLPPGMLEELGMVVGDAAAVAFNTFTRNFGDEIVGFVGGKVAQMQGGSFAKGQAEADASMDKLLTAAWERNPILMMGAAAAGEYGLWAYPFGWIGKAPTVGSQIGRVMPLALASDVAATLGAMEGDFELGDIPAIAATTAVKVPLGVASRWAPSWIKRGMGGGDGPQPGVKMVLWPTDPIETGFGRWLMNQPELVRRLSGGRAWAMPNMVDDALDVPIDWLVKQAGVGAPTGGQPAVNIPRTINDLNVFVPAATGGAGPGTM